GDRRHEAVVEGLGDPEARVQRVPAGADRQLVHAQLACVEQAEQLHRLEARLAQAAVLLGAVLADVPRVARALRTGRREGQHVGRAHVGGAAGSQHRAQVIEHGLRVLHVLDRLEEVHGGNVRQRALPGELERWHSVGLVALYVLPGGGQNGGEYRSRAGYSPPPRCPLPLRTRSRTRTSAITT